MPDRTRGRWVSPNSVYCGFTIRAVQGCVCCHQPQFDPPRPHVHLGDIVRAVPEQRGLRMQRLEISTDRDALGQHATIVERQRGRLAIGVHREERRRLVLRLGYRHLHHRDAHLLFGEEDPDAARVGRRRGTVVEQHRLILSRVVFSNIAYGIRRTLRLATRI
jgi:hypothetical protein